MTRSRRWVIVITLSAALAMTPVLIRGLPVLGAEGSVASPSPSSSGCGPHRPARTPGTSSRRARSRCRSPTSSTTSPRCSAAAPSCGSGGERPTTGVRTRSAPRASTASAPPQTACGPGTSRGTGSPTSAGPRGRGAPAPGCRRPATRAGCPHAQRRAADEISTLPPDSLPAALPTACAGGPSVRRTASSIARIDVWADRAVRDPRARGGLRQDRPASRHCPPRSSTSLPRSRRRGHRVHAAPRGTPRDQPPLRRRRYRAAVLPSHPSGHPARDARTASPAGLDAFGQYGRGVTQAIVAALPRRLARSLDRAAEGCRPASPVSLRSDRRRRPGRPAAHRPGAGR